MFHVIGICVSLAKKPDLKFPRIWRILTKTENATIHRYKILCVLQISDGYAVCK